MTQEQRSLGSFHLANTFAVTTGAIYILAVVNNTLQTLSSQNAVNTFCIHSYLICFHETLSISLTEQAQEQLYFLQASEMLEGKRIKYLSVDILII